MKTKTQRPFLKSSFLLVINLFILHILFAQPNLGESSSDDWYNTFGSKRLHVGDTMPDIPLGNVMNNYTGKTRFSDFKGKLVILDFWATTCTSCIALFPHMEQLQKEFGDSIQIILVDIEETQKQIEERLSRFKGKIKLPNLPCIVADQEYTSSELRNSSFFKLFPIREVPHHVWIDGNRVIRLIGDAHNTYANKIRQVLAGRNIFVMNNGNTLPNQLDNPYYNVTTRLKLPSSSYSSCITPYNNEIGSSTGEFREVTDTLLHTKTWRFINTDLLNIYLSVIGSHNFTDFLLSPNNHWFDFILLPKEIDTLQYTSRDFITKRSSLALSDIEYMQSKYCYEFTIPSYVTEEKRRLFMLEDLNRYFGENYGTVAALEKHRIPCYILVRTSQHDKVESKLKGPGYMSVTDLKKKSKQLKEYKNTELSTVIFFVGHNDNQTLSTLIKQNRTEGEPFLILNGTGWDDNKKVDMVFPAGELKSISDFKNSLKPYDLDIIVEEKEISFIVFKYIK